MSLKGDVRVAKRYAAALFDAVWDESGQDGVDAAAADLGVVEELLANVTYLRAVILQPMVSNAEKRNVIEQAFQARLGKNTYNFLNLLIDKRREDIIDEIIAEYRRLADEKAGRVEAYVETPVALEDSQLEKLQAALERRTGKTIKISAVLQPTMLGGIRVRIGDEVLDASLKSRLDTLHALLLAAR